MNSKIIPPKVFVSHASEDKLRFVESFAIRLRNGGIDAWLDKWEMLPGDSLVDKIFEEGLKEASAVIIVLSEFSVSKPWVREEINSSFVSRIQKGTRIIPVIIGDCEVPEALKTTLWERITNLSSYDESFDRISASIFGKVIKPEIGYAPDYTSVILRNIDGLEAVDNLVLKKSCEYIVENTDNPISPEDIFLENNTDSPPKSEVLDSIEVLESEGYFDVSRYIGGGPDSWGCHYQVTLFGFEEYCKAYVSEYGKMIDDCVALIVNENVNTNLELRDTLNISLMFINHIIRLLENNDCLKTSGEIGERIHFYNVSAKLRRSLQ